MFDERRDTEFVEGSWPHVHHVIDKLNLGDDWASAGALHQGLDVADSQTNEEVHDDNWEQEDISSKEQVGSA